MTCWKLRKFDIILLYLYTGYHDQDCVCCFELGLNGLGTRIPFWAGSKNRPKNLWSLFSWVLAQLVSWPKSELFQSWDLFWPSVWVIGFDNLRALFCEWAIGLKFKLYIYIYIFINFWENEFYINWYNLWLIKLAWFSKK